MRQKSKKGGSSECWAEFDPEEEEAVPIFGSLAHS